MSKLKEKELLEWLDVWFKFYSTEFIPQLRALSPKKAEKIYSHKEQAYQQIKEMIQKPEGLPQKRGLTIDEIISKYPMSVRILLVQLVEQVRRLEKKKPKVTEKLIKEQLDKYG